MIGDQLIGDQSKVLKQYAAELREIAASAKFSWSRHVAEKMADEYERRAVAVANNEADGPVDLPS